MKESNNSYYDIEIGIIVIMLVLFLILSIFNGKDEKNSVDYWDKHKEERSEYLNKCNNGDVCGRSQACKNARFSLYKEEEIN
ncbi:hypothetical protein B6D20_13595 [Gilliamella apicola]|uniref:EexN family lipoprotein n=1 Tax=Gilliamella apicola TaxID=1196095 RepID=UPI000A3550B3|nr:EexN family lipoprotein [Gilliamella apicola]OTQ32074.1 hypothetical protein B6D20_13595 [Gilliamella apicola]